MISFYYQNYSLLLLLTGILWSFLIYKSWCTMTRVIRAWGNSFQCSTARATLKSVLVLGAGWILVGALLRPQSHIKYSYQKQETPVLLMGLDISSSMNVGDSTGSIARRAQAQKIIVQILDALPATRIGLLLFADRAWIQVPPTVDRGVIKDAIEALDAHMLVRSGTNMKGVFEYLSQLSVDNKIYAGVPIIIITDGEQSAHRVFEKYPGGAVLLIGVGSVRGGPIPEYNEQGVVTGHLKKSTGEIITSRADHDFLKEAAQELGGEYKSGETSTSDDIIRAAEHCSARAVDNNSGYQQRYAYEYWPLLVKIAWLLLALECIL